MMRPFTLISALLFVLSGAYLFAVKHRAQTLQDKMEQVAQATRQDEQRIIVLQAQWALEADPSRLAKLSAQFTSLQPMKPAQLVTLAALGADLPPAGTPAPDQNPAGRVAPMPLPPAPPPGSGAVPGLDVAAASPAPATPSAPVQAAAYVPAARVLPPPPAPPPPARPRNLSSVLADNAPPRPAPKPGSSLAQVETLVHSLPATAPAHPPAPRLADSGAAPRAVPEAAHAPAPHALLGASVMPVRAVAPASPAAPPLPAETGGSLLGMAQTMGGSGN